MIEDLPDPETLSTLSAQQAESLYPTARALYSTDPSKAKAYFKMLVLLMPCCYEYWFGYAATLQVLKEYEPALQAYAAASILQPNLPDPHVEATICYLRLGNQEEAKKAWMTVQDKKRMASPSLQEKIQKLLSLFEL